MVAHRRAIMLMAFQLSAAMPNPRHVSARSAQSALQMFQRRGLVFAAGALLATRRRPADAAAFALPFVGGPSIELLTAPRVRARAAT